MDFQTRVLRDPNSHDGLASNHHHNHHHNNYDNYARFSSAMAIPGPAPSFERTVPPPLPPPRMPLTNPSNSGGGACHCYRGGGGSLGHSHGAAGSSSNYGSVAAGSFGSDGAHPDFRRRDPSAYARRGDGSTGTGRDEGYASFSSSRSSRDSVPAQQFLGHSRFEFVSYGDSLKDKLNASRTLDMGSNKAASLSASQPPPPPPPPPPRSALSASLNVDTRTTYPPRPAPDRYSDRYPDPLSLPSRPRPLLEESDRFTQTPIRSGLSPGGHAGAPSFSPFHHLERRATNDSILATELDRASPRRPRRADSSSFFPDDVTESTQVSADDDDMEVGHLRLDDSFRSGQKRRASSPAVDEIAQGYPSRGSPTPRLSAIIHPTAGSTTSAMTTSSSSSSSSAAAAAAAAAGRWTNHSAAYGSSSLSNIGLAAAAAAAIAVVGSGDFTRRSSVPYSTDGASVSPLGTEVSPFTSPPPSSVDPSPRGSISRACTGYPRPYGEPRPSALPSPRRVMVVKAAGATVQDFYMCECCPKKPKKFDTMDQLSSHMSEKQYECTFCGNRFKNKNEAERHQNSLHVRSHSWSCSALSSYDRAFHESTARPGLADTCGYCGIDFDRRGEVVLTASTGGGGTSPTISKGGRAISERDWEERVRHLQEIHKFRECNSGKKFYRADHFRQHLKHSHAGSSGKWTNMLENACMIEERYDKADGGRPSVSSCRETWDP